MADWDDMQILNAYMEMVQSPRIKEFLSRNQGINRVFNGFGIEFFEIDGWIEMHLSLHPEFTTEELRARESDITGWYQRLKDYQGLWAEGGQEEIYRRLVESGKKPKDLALMINRQIHVDLRHVNTWGASKIQGLLKNCVDAESMADPYDQFGLRIDGHHSGDASLANAWGLMIHFYTVNKIETKDKPKSEEKSKEKRHRKIEIADQKKRKTEHILGVKDEIELMLSTIENGAEFSPTTPIDHYWLSVKLNRYKAQKARNR